MSDPYAIIIAAELKDEVFIFINMRTSVVKKGFTRDGVEYVTTRHTCDAHPLTSGYEKYNIVGEVFRTRDADDIDEQYRSKFFQLVRRQFINLNGENWGSYSLFRVLLEE